MTRFKYDVYWFILLLIAPFVVVLANREHGVHLAHECVSTESSSNDKLPLIMLHGLSEVKETWDDIYPHIPSLTGRKVCVYDARNHGDSGWNNTFNLDVLVEDLRNFMADINTERAALVGHSMGGFTIMKFALENPSKVERIFVEDISPLMKKMPSDTVATIISSFRVLLDSLSVIPAEADEETAKKAVIDYCTNVVKIPIPWHFKRFQLGLKNGVWQWKSNFEAFIRALEDFDSFLGKMTEGQYDGSSFFIYGETSPLKVNEDKEGILKLFPNAEFFGVKGASHMVHNHTTAYLSKLVEFLNQGESQNKAQDEL